MSNQIKLLVTQLTGYLAPAPLCPECGLPPWRCTCNEDEE